MAHGPICREVGMIRDHPAFSRADASIPGQSQGHFRDAALAVDTIQGRGYWESG